MGVGSVRHPLISAVGLTTAVAILCSSFLTLRCRTAYTLLLGFIGGAVLEVALFGPLSEAIEDGAVILGSVGIARCLAVTISY
ncbi:hypothetical protein MCBMB27_05563 [Methylobacterium phyllosphaerae]|uniref:Uncharacterized protein n=1 Tax=Methylobacterium phyllosphaerae TaxID=418223 RepID=A0AAE8HV73_9HYPH|nr:hypothetical protein MCBMB27_05563 [Methylobacterium phyllosphaerae]SFH35481.1 hypothetical protein SAMN05192567_12162 [Methylobacterium phyllosphaerae]